MLCLYMHSDRQSLMSMPPLACVLNEKHASAHTDYNSNNRQSVINSRNSKSVSFDPFTHASTMLHQQSDFTWSIFDNVLARALRSMASALSNLPQDPRAKKSSAIILAPSPIIISPSFAAATAAVNINNKRCSTNNKRASQPLKQRHRHVCWQPITPGDDETTPHHLNNNNNTALPAWMFTHKHSRDIRSNPDEIRKLAVKLEMVRHQKLTIGRVKSERKRHLPTRSDDFVPCRKSCLSQQL